MVRPLLIIRSVRSSIGVIVQPIRVHIMQGIFKMGRETNYYDFFDSSRNHQQALLAMQDYETRLAQYNQKVQTCAEYVKVTPSPPFKFAHSTEEAREYSRQSFEAMETSKQRWEQERLCASVYADLKPQRPVTWSSVRPALVCLISGDIVTCY